MNTRPGNRKIAEGFIDDSHEMGGEHNPYVRSHRAFGPEVVPADVAKGLGGRWQAIFGREAPLHLELGAGNGQYLAGMARLHPDRDWLGLELRFKRVELAARKVRAAGVTNARVVRYNWFFLPEIFTEGSLAGLHLHHPDPWEHRTQAHNRLIDAELVALAGRLLAPGAEWRLKTDFAPHADTLLGLVPGSDFEVVGAVRDVAREGAPWPDEVVTNYQRKSGERGAPVLAVWLRRR